MIPLALAGVGKIARDQHLPAIAGDGGYDLAATVTLGEPLAGIPNFASITDLKAGFPDVAAVAICTPPIGRSRLVADAVAVGLAIMIEKPPAATLGEAHAIARMAADGGVPLFTAWHSREAAAVGVARRWLAGRAIRTIAVRWHENIREWHPGQEWIWQPGIGVFDPAINAFSILSSLVPAPLIVTAADLSFPANRDAPIAARLALEAGTIPVTASLDFDHRTQPVWQIDIATDDGLLSLHDGGAGATVDGAPLIVGPHAEYAALYARFRALIAADRSDVDLEPLRIVADAFFLGRRRTTAAFDW